MHMCISIIRLCNIVFIEMEGNYDVRGSYLLWRRLGSLSICFPPCPLAYLEQNSARSREAEFSESSFNRSSFSLSFITLSSFRSFYQMPGFGLQGRVDDFQPMQISRWFHRWNGDPSSGLHLLLQGFHSFYSEGMSLWGRIPPNHLFISSCMASSPCTAHSEVFPRLEGFERVKLIPGYALSVTITDSWLVRWAAVIIESLQSSWLPCGPFGSVWVLPQ